MTHARWEIAISDAELADLDARLDLTRWSDPAPGGGWAQGTEDAFLGNLVERWRSQFDWRQQEKQLNSVANYVADVDGTRLHFVRERGRGPRPMPLLLGHGCYSNFYEFHKVIGPLTDPPRTAVIRTTRSTSWSGRCRASASRTGRPSRAATSSAWRISPTG